MRNFDRRFLLALALLVSSSNLYPAIPAAATWEIRPTLGNATNGGGYVTGTTATTTDYSQNDNKNAAGCSNCGSSTQDLSTTDAVANGTTTITSATANFVAIKGNIVYFQGGTGAIAAVRRQVVSVTNTTTIVLDAAIAASTGMTMNVGGALADIVDALTDNTNSNTYWVKASGTLVRTATITLDNGVTPARNVPPNRLIGYSTTRGDNGRPTIQLSTNTGLTALSDTVGGWYFSNFIIDCNGLGTSTGLRVFVSGQANNNKITNCRSFGINASGNTFAVLINNEVSGLTSCTQAIHAGNNSGVFSNFVHDNGCTGIMTEAAGSIVNNLVTNNSGASTDGIHLTTSNNVFYVYNNTVYNSGRYGINYSQAFILGGVIIKNNLLVDNGAYGLKCGDLAGSPAMPAYDGNAYYSNTSGTREFCDDTGATNAGYGGGNTYTNVYDVILTADPFTNAAGGDFSLNGTAGGGLAARGTALPGVLQGTGGTGFMSFGVLQPEFGTSPTAPSAGFGCKIRN